MATGGGASLMRGGASEPRVRSSGSRVHRSLGGAEDNFRFNWIGEKDEGRPNNYWDWKPSSTFADPTMDGLMTVSSGKKSKTKNKDREKKSTASAASAQDSLTSSPPRREPSRRHTPATFPRTRNVASVRERAELEMLKQQLTFSDMEEPLADSPASAAINNVRRDVKTQSRKSPQVNHSEEATREVVHQRTQSANEANHVNEMADRNQIVARLMQIRDYMKQAASMMTNLNTESSEDGTDEQVAKLVNLQNHLHDQERGYLALLERMLSDEGAGRSSHNSNESQSTSIAESASINIDAQSDISEATTGNVDMKTRMEELEGLRQQHDLLKKMLQQQEELRALQNRQNALMLLQEDLEGRIKKSEDQSADESSQSTTDVSTSDLQEAERTFNVADFELARARGGDADLNDQRRELLMMILSEDMERRAPEMRQARMLDRLDIAEREQNEVAAMNSEQEHLLSTLQALQQKKQQMDDLLHQLHALRPSIPGADTDSAMSAASSSHLLEPAQLQRGEEVKEAQLVGGASDDNEAMDKLRRLQEVRQRLDDLRDLVQQYRGLDGAAGVDESGDGRKTSSSVNFEDPELMSNLRRLERGEPVGRFQSAHQALLQQLDTTEDGTSTLQSEDDSQLTTDNESNQSLLAAWGDDPEIRGKIKKLQAAKQKLRHLQELVAIVQHSPEVAIGLPDDLAELAASWQEELDTSNAENEDEEEEEEEDVEDEGNTTQTASVISEGDVPQVSQETKDAYYEAKMQQQRRELDKLQDERHRLLAVQEQLRDLNHHIPLAKQGVKSTNTTQRNPLMPGSGLRQLAATGNMQDAPSPTHDSLMAEKLRHRRLQTELKLKQQELAALMDRVKRNTGEVSDSGSAQGDSNDNDLFRVSMRSADVTAAASWGGSTQQSEDEEDDAYPSDGILQVEEEEEQEQSLAGTTSTYTIDDEYCLPNRRPNSYPGQRMMTNGPPTTMDLEAMHGIRYPKWATEQKLRASAESKRQQNLQAADELMAEASGGFESNGNFYMGQVHQLQQQLQNSIGLCQSLMRDQQVMNNMLQGSMSGGFNGMQGPVPAHTPTTPTPTNGDPRMMNMMNDYNMRLQHQQLQLNMNHSYNQLYQQQQEMERMRTEGPAVGGSGPSGRPFGFESGGETNANNNRVQGVFGYDAGTSFSPFENPYQQERSGVPQPSLLDYTSPYSQMSEASRRRQRDYDAYARHRQEQETRQRDYHVPPNTAQGSLDQYDYDRDGNLVTDYNKAPYAYAERAADMNADGQASGQGYGQSSRLYVPPLDIKSLLERSDKQRMLAAQASSSGTKADTKKSNILPSLSTKAKDSQARPSTSKRRGPRPGLSSSLSGTAFMEVASVASTMSISSMPGDLERERKMQMQDTERSIKSTSEMESDAGSEFSLFEALRESIYSEVATLISQNESRPHFLIELFRELQMLNSDYLRQRALYSLQDLVSKYLTDDAANSHKGGAAGKQKQNMRHEQRLWQMSTTASEHTPSESLITSEEEEIKAQIYSKNPNKQAMLQALQSMGSLDAEEYDYVESVGSASSMSTPPSFSQDFGFANDELGDTVIHLDKALQRMREYERLKAEAEASAAISSDASASVDKAAVSNSEVTSNSSAQDMGSESSFSDLPYPRIDTRQLDLQIKSIMQEVIPYLKEHMDDVCSPQLLSYIRRLVLTLSKQRDDSREFVRFFNRQLGSILQDSLSKFSGRKMRECGEDLLVDISEILFNELAFFRLMQDLDTAGNKLRKEAGEIGEDEEEEEEEDEGVTGTETGTETGTGAEEEDGSEDEGSSSDSEDDSSLSDDAEEPSSVTPVPVAPKPSKKPSFDEVALETAMDMATSREEEELGKTRDDDLARNMETSEQDDDSESALAKDQVKIELSMSETNAVNYLGSGEDDDEYDEMSAREDETITSIGAAAAQVENDNQGTESTTQPTSDPADTPKTDTDSLQATPTSGSNLPNGNIETNNLEVTIDDLPPKMTSLAEVDIEMKVAEEQAPATILAEIIETIASGEAALAGDPEALKEPDANHVTPIISNGAGDALTEAVQPTDPEVKENGM
ncbi:pericentriolar material 1 protein-like isoform X2 [Asterias rubens]|uniref:pericentriolar material 1 protein-like isoform X2 n=1 Tax=Asterias rubens TaxID=7604 RepID=UPI001455B7F1|nr:pericentriolar material 1 protein-like isoform X2 [Asterias rubens]